MGVGDLVAVSCLSAKEYHKQRQKLFIPLLCFQIVPTKFRVLPENSLHLFNFHINRNKGDTSINCFFNYRLQGKLFPAASDAQSLDIQSR